MIPTADIFRLLETLKTKALDAKDVELLKHAYTWLNENLKQITANNQALKESTDLLREKVTRLEGELAATKATLSNANAALTKAAARASSQDLPAKLDALTPLTQGLLQTLASKDKTRVESLVLKRITPNLSDIQRQAAIDELIREDLLIQAGASPETGLEYSFTSDGKRALLTIQSKK